MATSTGTLPINSLINVNQPSSSNSNGLTSQLGADAFLKLLTVQLQNQDPTQPMDDTQSVAQLAQFSALQASTNMAASFQAFQSNFGVMQAATLIGKPVTVVSTDSSGNSSNISGTISQIQVQNGTPYFTMTGSNGQPILDSNGNPQQFQTSQIVTIGN